MMNNLSQYKLTNITRQRGAMALLMSLVILTLITFVSLYTAKTVSLEQKISGNDYRSRVAFEAAEAGIEAAITYVSSSNGGADRSAPANGVADELIFETNGDVVVGLPDGDEVNEKTFANNSKVIVSFSGTDTNINVTALGISGDGAAQRKIERNVAVLNPLPNFPNVPVSAKGDVTVNGSATVNNPEGRSTIRTGGPLNMGGSSGVNTKIADQSSDNIGACLGGDNACGNYSTLEGCDSTPTTNYVKCEVKIISENGVQNIDIDQNFLDYKNATGAEFFQNMFGMSKSAFKARRVTRFVEPANFPNLYTAADDGVDQAHGEVIWVDGDVLSPTGTGGVIAGCYYTTGAGPNGKSDAFDESCAAADGVLDPVIIIIDGDVDFTNSPQFFGLIYVTGSITSSGNTEIQGALAQEDETATVAVTGSLDIWYDSAILEGTANSGPYAASSGTWKDF